MKALADCIRTYDDALPAAFCQQLIDNFEASAPFQMPDGSGYRPALDDSRWTELNLMHFDWMGDHYLLIDVPDLLDVETDAETALASADLASRARSGPRAT